MSARHRLDRSHTAALIRATVPPLHPGGRPIVAGIVGASLVLRTTARAVGLRRLGRGVGGLGLTAGLASALFFRSPTRVPPTEPDVIVAPADGVVSLIEEAVPPAELGLDATPRLRLSIFLSVFDVHVQRIPAAGTVRAVAYRAGKFLSADLDKASTDNERNSLVIDTLTGHELVVTQIAGLVARRIVCDVSAGSAVRTGELYGLIRFGSRLDTYLPAGAEPVIRLGQRTIGGETVLARCPAGAAPDPTA